MAPRRRNYHPPRPRPKERPEIAHGLAQAKNAIAALERELRITKKRLDFSTKFLEMAWTWRDHLPAPLLDRLASIRADDPLKYKVYRKISKADWLPIAREYLAAPEGHRAAVARSYGVSPQRIAYWIRLLYAPPAEGLDSGPRTSDNEPRADGPSPIDQLPEAPAYHGHKGIGPTQEVPSTATDVAGAYAEAPSPTTEQQLSEAEPISNELLWLVDDE